MTTINIATTRQTYVPAATNAALDKYATDLAAIVADWQPEHLYRDTSLALFLWATAQCETELVRLEAMEVAS